MSSHNLIAQASPEQAWEALQTHRKACLVDVRTRSEWHNDGVADVPALQMIFLSLVDSKGILNPDFISFLEQNETLKVNPLYFLCKVGVRSQKAAELAYHFGFQHVFNITGGFLGNKLAHSMHAAVTDEEKGWKAVLPWRAYIH